MSRPSTPATIRLPGAPGGGFSRPLLALILGQVSLHACMARVRVAVPLQALQQGQPAWVIGLLMAMFALAPVPLALSAGRLADRRGYHFPLRVAVALSLAGGLAACLGSHALWMGLAAALTGAGATMGLITCQRTAGHMAGSQTDRVRIFSWVGLAPALANVVGPVVAGLLIDLAGFGTAFGVLAVMPLAALAWARAVPREQPRVPLAGAGRADGGGAANPLASARAGERAAAGPGAGPAPHRSSLGLLRLAPLRRLLLVNWLLLASWDVHAFVLPLLGHQRGFSASIIGLILGVFAGSVALVRLLVPLVAHRLSESQAMVGAMVWSALVFAVYPLVPSAWGMACCAALLGLSLGIAQPLIMSRLYHITPADRHGEVIALRSMTINASSTVMPLLFGLVGTVVGTGALLWLMGAAVGAGSLRARRL